jgi:hypothetical protein
MLNEDKKKHIESLSDSEMEYEINLGRRSRFQREAFAYLQTCYQQRNKEAEEHVIRTKKVTPILPFIQERLKPIRKEIDADLYLWLSGKKHPNLEFSGSLVLNYWGPYLDGHVQKIIDSAFAVNKEIAIEYDIDPSNSVADAAFAAEEAIKSLLDLMINYDQKMRGKGYPQNVPRRDITEIRTKCLSLTHVRAENENKIMSLPKINNNVEPKKGDSSKVPNPASNPSAHITNNEYNWQNKTLYYIAVGVIIAVLAVFIIYLIKTHLGISL